MQDSDFASEVLTKEANRRLGRIVFGSLLMFVLMFATVYSVSLIAEQSTLNKWATSGLFGKIRETLPFDYERFLRSDNTQAAGRVWFLELIIWSMTIATGTFYLFLYAWFLFSNKDGWRKLVERPFRFKEVFSSLSILIFVPAWYVSGYQDLLINGTSRRSIGANDMVVMLHFFSATIYLLALSTLSFLLLSVAGKILAKFQKVGS